jgi:hypothetical protein
MSKNRKLDGSQIERTGEGRKVVFSIEKTVFDSKRIKIEILIICFVLCLMPLLFKAITTTMMLLFLWSILFIALLSPFPPDCSRFGKWGAGISSGISTGVLLISTLISKSSTAAIGFLFIPVFAISPLPFGYLIGLFIRWAHRKVKMRG